MWLKCVVLQPMYILHTYIHLYGVWILFIVECWCPPLLPCAPREMMMEQADNLEAMHEQRMQLLTQSIRKVVQSKKRRRDEEGEEADVSSDSE